MKFVYADGTIPREYDGNEIATMQNINASGNSSSTAQAINLSNNLSVAVCTRIDSSNYGVRLPVSGHVVPGMVAEIYASGGDITVFLDSVVGSPVFFDGATSVTVVSGTGKRFRFLPSFIWALIG